MNTFGKIFKLTVFGESHGVSVGVIIDGCPAGIAISESDFLVDLARRKTGTKGTSSRSESDYPKLLSGVHNGFSTGSPISILFENLNAKPEDYENLKNTPRPGHADFVAQKKFRNFNDHRGGGHFSGRITLGMVAAGVIAKKIIQPISIVAKIEEICGKTDFNLAINEAIKAKDSIGGIISCTAKNMKIGLGEPFFYSLESYISHLIFSIPGVKAIEFGAGFAAAKMKGSECNDNIIDIFGKTETNNSGGINGGIANGNDLFFKLAVKPTSSIALSQKTMNFKTKELTNLHIKGRHDACMAMRMPPIVEAATAIALADLMFQNQNRK